jgi:peptidoglycan lytic transglycosylase D
MSWRTLALIAAATAAISCRSASVALPTQAQATVTPAMAPAHNACEGLQDEVDALLESAQSAAGARAKGEFDACDTAILQKLSTCLGSAGSSPATVAYLGRVLDELDRLDDVLAPGEDDDQPTSVEDAQDELHPEPQPVPSARIVQEREKARAAHYDLPVVVNSEVTSLIEYYTGPFRDRFALALDRAARYLPFIKQELRRARLPEDLAFLPLVESAFNPNARSPARAKGLWQFIKGTARLYDLRCDRMVDERNDPYLSTRAAVAHLAELYAEFGSWELALSAYNSGPGRVERALRRAHGDTDFWRIRRYLPRETRNYVPALWAALVVVKNLPGYGFPPIVERPECLRRVTVDGVLDLDVVAERTGMDADALAAINPALLHRMIPARGSYALAVPCGREQQVSRIIASLTPGERTRNYLHVVRRGETLAAIARRYGSSVQTILAANHVRDARALRIGRTLVVPRDGQASRPAAADWVASHAVRQTKPARRLRVPQHYRVRRGDTLFSIARRFGLTVGAIQAVNGLASNLIHPGDVLRLLN